MTFKDIVKVLGNGHRVYNYELDMDVIAVSIPIGRGKLFLGDYHTKKVYVTIDEVDVMDYSFNVLEV